MEALVKIRYAIACCMSVAMVVGCSGGFKSRVFSRQEVTDYFNKLNGPPANPNDPSHAQVAGDTNGNGNVTPAGQDDDKVNSQVNLTNQAAGIPAAPDVAAPADSTVVLNQDSNTPGANSKVFIEELPPESAVNLAEESTQQFEVKNPDAGKIVRGIDISVTGPKEAVVLNMKAIVNLTGAISGAAPDLKFLTVENSPVKYIENGQIAGSSAVSVRNAPNQPELTDLKGIGVRAWCLESADCVSVQVRLEVTSQDKMVPAIFEFQLQDDGTYAMTNKNLLDEDFRTYDAAKAILDAQVAEMQQAANAGADASATEAATETPAPADTGAATPAAAPAATPAASTAPAATGTTPAAPAATRQGAFTQRVNGPEAAADAASSAMARARASGATSPAATPAAATPAASSTAPATNTPPAAPAATRQGAFTQRVTGPEAAADAASSAMARSRASSRSTPAAPVATPNPSTIPAVAPAAATPAAANPSAGGRLTFGAATDAAIARAGGTAGSNTPLAFGQRQGGFTQRVGSPEAAADAASSATARSGPAAPAVTPSRPSVVPAPAATPKPVIRATQTRVTFGAAGDAAAARASAGPLGNTQTQLTFGNAPSK